MPTQPLDCITGVLLADPSMTVSDIGRYRLAVPVRIAGRRPARHRAGPVSAPDLLVAVGPLANRAFSQFTASDRFFALGSFSVLPEEGSDPDDTSGTFLATALGHDLTQHRYAIDRTRRHRTSVRREPQRPRCHGWGDRILQNSSTGKAVAS